METEQQEQKSQSQTGLIVFLLIVILGILIFILYMVYRERQKTIKQRISQAFGIKKKSNTLQSLKHSGQSFWKSVRQSGKEVADDFRKSFRSGKKSHRGSRLSANKSKK